MTPSFQMDTGRRHLPLFPERRLPHKASAAEEECRPVPEKVAAGTVIGGFEVVREMGRGAMGVVLEARLGSPERLAALKVLHTDPSTPPARVARFRAEAALAARVSHPAILPVLSVGKENGYDYYATAFASGITLAQFIDEALGTRGEVFFREAALRFADLARTVEALHRAGVIHRKIKPSNLHLEGDRFLLVDFELAVDAGADGPRPEDHFLAPRPARTLVYLAPEEFVRGAAVDPQADVYSLGMSLYELATGILPFPRCSAEELARLKLTRRPIAPRRLNPDVPLGLEAVIRQAIEVSPRLRYASAEELAYDLERFASQKRGPTRRHEPPGLPEPPQGPGEDEEGGEGGDSRGDLAPIA